MPRNLLHHASSLIAAGFLFLGALSHASGATIIWGQATTIVGDADVSTAGSLVAAFNFGTIGGTATVNGVSFANAGTVYFDNLAPSHTFGAGAGRVTLAGSSPLFSADAFNSGSAPFSELSASYKSLLNSAVWIDSAENKQITLTIEGLTIGQQYQVQLWTNDSRSHGVNRDTSFDSVVLEQNTGPMGGLGQWVIGTFTADDTFQTIIANAAGNGQSTNINAYQLRAIPEPSTYAIIAGAGALVAALCFRRRTRANDRSV